MSCPHCAEAARSNAKFCHQCGERVGNDCPACGASNPPESKFCGSCGNVLKESAPLKAKRSDRYTEVEKAHIISQGERRHLTILFTDLSGYTKLMETYDPEDIQAVMTAVTKTCIDVIQRYNGHIERVIGDAILALFGLPVTHEDDAIRAVKAAREIHTRVSGLKHVTLPTREQLAMHTGINTGLVVTARTAPADGAFDLSGDAVNLASRLCDLSQPNEILVGPETHRQAFGFFNFESKDPVTVKGKSLPISIYSVTSEKNRPVAGRRKLNFYSTLVGRHDQMDTLIRAMEKLEQGQGSIISIIGEAGTGKSRLLYEFEREMADRRNNWITGYAFAHTQPVPYFPLVHLVRRWLELDGSATEEEMSAGIARRVGELLGANAKEIPIIKGLIGMDVQETMGMSPEEWRKQLKSAMLNLLNAIARQAPTVFCMEDIHWGDSSSFKLLKDIIFNFEVPALVICTMRPHASLFTSHEQELIASIYQAIRIGELSPAETEDMMESMLDTDALPDDLVRLVSKRAEGNPFYLEEILNALVDSDALSFENGRWSLNRAFKESDIPSTIHGVIASRMDQLGHEERRILQEAAVIGRAFLYNILKRISVHPDAVDASLYKLERAGLIKPRALHPEMEFMFKHALIQEVSYGSLLRRERQRVHERIGLTIEQIYQDRLSEFDETLAIHFQKSTATDKATDYLIRSGTKALRRCALDESDQYFKTAKAMLEQQQLAQPGTKKRLLDVANQWAFVFYYKGLNRQLLELLEHQRSLVEGLKDPVREGYHWAWHGCALWHRHRFAPSHESLTRALDLGRSADDPYLLGYAHTWISWPCTELGRFDAAIENAKNAVALYADGEVKDAYIYFNALTAMGYAYWHMGDIDRTAEIGQTLVKFGKRHSNVRSLVSGYSCIGWKDLIIGDIDSAIEHFSEAVQISADPWYSQFPKLALCYGSISNGKIDEALPYLDQLIRFSEDNGAEFVGDPAYFFKGLTDILNGQVAKGLDTMESLLDRWQAEGSRLRCLTCGYVMARVYGLLSASAIQTAGSPESPHVIGLAQKAMHWFNTCIKEADAMGAVAMKGQNLLGLGNLFAALNKTDQAGAALAQSHAILKDIGASHHLKEAETALTALEMVP